MAKFPITEAGFALLSQELSYRMQIVRPRLVERIRNAIASEADLIENSEYQAAVADQEINDARILELEDKLARVEVIDASKLSGDTIKFGATVTLLEETNGKKEIWQIVGEPEADAHKRKISVAAPVSRALIGKRTGDHIEVDTPGGGKLYKVLQVNWGS